MNEQAGFGAADDDEFQIFFQKKKKKDDVWTMRDPHKEKVKHAAGYTHSKLFFKQWMTSSIVTLRVWE